MLARAIYGSSAQDYAPPAFTLIDQHGRTVTLAGLRGRVVLLTFLNPVCTSACPPVAQELKQAGNLLGAQDRQVELVAIAADAVDYHASYIQAFDRREGLTGIRNWLYLTGSLAQLGPLWAEYGIASELQPAGTTVSQGHTVFVVDPGGRVRQEIYFGQGSGTTAIRSSFADELADAAQQLLGRS